MKRFILIGVSLLLHQLVFAQIQENNHIKDISVTKVLNDELAEVLSLCHLDTSLMNNSYELRLFRVENGPGNPDLDYCNSSTNYYLCNSFCGLPSDIRLFKIGPFFELDSMKLITTQKDSEKYLLKLFHWLSNHRFVSTYGIEFDSIVLLEKIQID
jgi:hypothetical protein